MKYLAKVKKINRIIAILSAFLPTCALNGECSLVQAKTVAGDAAVR
jgi:hypothetical protein